MATEISEQLTKYLADVDSLDGDPSTPKVFALVWLIGFFVHGAEARWYRS